LNYNDINGIYLDGDLQSNVIYESEYNCEGNPFKIRLISHDKEFQKKLSHGKSYDLYFDLYNFYMIFSEEPSLEVHGFLTEVLDE